MYREKKSNLGLGLMLGAAVGFVAGLFVAPKPGNETREEVAKKLKDLKRSIDDGELRERVEEMFGEVTDEGMKTYKNARKEIAKRLDEFKDDVDYDRYRKIVEDVIAQVRDQKISAESVMALKEKLMSEWVTDGDKPKKRSSKK